MKILHCCLSCFYIDNYSYQENILPRQNKYDGHEVKIIASTETFVDNKNLGYIEPKCYNTKENIPIIRLPYSKLLPQTVMRKIRKYKGLKNQIELFSPDVILFHGCCGWELATVAKYKKVHPHVKLYVDSHEDFLNSARNFISRNILHKLFYKRVLLRAYPWIEKILYLSEEAKLFLRTLYGLPDDKLEFYPLGGIIPAPEERASTRARKRSELGLSDDNILVCHSGKLEAPKRTEELLKAFSRVASDSLRLIIIGSIPEDMKPVLDPLIAADKRVTFLGWKSGDELQEYLCACDLYAQPGSQSATMQNALCCGAPVMLYPHQSYRAFEEEHGMRENGYFVESIDEMAEVFHDIILEPQKIKIMSDKSLKFSESILDYKRLALRLYK